MKLSVAIRIGSLTTTQIIGRGTDGRNGRCALGAALDAKGVKINNSTVLDDIRRTFPITKRTVVYPGSGFPITLVSAIWGLNDLEWWSREKIADWVEEIENEFEKEKTVSINTTIPIPDANKSLVYSA